MHVIIMDLIWYLLYLIIMYILYCSGITANDPKSWIIAICVIAIYFCGQEKGRRQNKC